MDLKSKLPGIIRIYRRALVILAAAAMLYCAAVGVLEVMDRFGGIGGLCAELFTGEAAWGEGEGERAPLEAEKREEPEYI